MNEPWRRLPALSLKQIQYFVTLAQIRQFTETANHLAISQPALSSALRQIEALLGGKLVERAAGGVRLTELGRAILPHAERLLNTAHAAFADMQRVANTGEEGALRIAMIPSITPTAFPIISHWAQQLGPNIRLDINDRSNEALIASLLSHEIDCGIGAMDSSVPDTLETYPLVEDRLVVVLRRDDPLAAETELTWAQLSDRDIALFSRGDVNTRISALKQSQRVQLNLSYHVEFSETLYNLVRARFAVAILPRLYISSASNVDLEAVELTMPAITRTIALMRHPAEEYESPVMSKYFDSLVDSLRRSFSPGDQRALEDVS